jgi:protein-S-isoprenylcysteine O-methyltransferase Ste14
MRPPVFVWPYGVVFWVVFVWAFWPELILLVGARKSAERRESKDAGSLRLVTFGMSAALFAAFPLAYVQGLRFTRVPDLVALIAGTVVLALGSLLRRHCWRTLGRYFTFDVQARADQPVIQQGAYRWVRHPSYTAGMLMVLGVGIAVANWLSLFILLVVSIAVYAYRVSVEERVLLDTLGEDYAAYARRTRRFIPFIL